MNKSIIISLVIAGVLSVTGAAWWMARSDQSASNQSVSQSEATQKQTRSTIDALLTQGDDMKCTYDGVDESGNQNKGTLYISNDRLRGDFELTTSDGTATSHMISDKQVQYVWQDGETQGYKLDLSSFDAESKQNVELQKSTQTVDRSQEQDFTCEGWSVDNSKFEVPTDIEFVDFAELFQQLQNAFQ